MSRTKYMTPRISEKECQIITSATAYEADSLSMAVRVLAAYGLKYQMIRHVKPINEKYLNSLRPLDFFEEYGRFIFAVNKDAGIGTANEYRFEVVPENSNYFEKSKDTYLVLHETEMFGPDGGIWRKK